MKSKPNTTDHEINGFIDNELDSVERAQVLEDASQSKEINSQIADYRRMKDYVKNAYANVPMPRTEMPQANSLNVFTKRWLTPSDTLFWPALSLSLLVIVGGVSGAHVMFTQNIAGDSLAPIVAKGIVQAEGKSTHYLLHLSSNDYSKMDLVLTRAESLLATNLGHSNLKIEVIANAKGIDLMREDTSPFKERISRLSEKGVLFEACSRTMEQLHQQNRNPALVAEVNSSMTAMQRVADGVKNGGIYESI